MIQGLRRPTALVRRSALLTLIILLGIVAGRGHPLRAQAVAHGRVLMADGHTLRLFDLDASSERDLLMLPANAFVYFPVWLPDGRSFVYAVQHVYTGDPNADYGTDIWLGDTGGASRVIWTHDVHGADIDGLAVSADGRTLLFGYTRTDLAADGSLLDQVIRVNRLDLQSGAIAPFAEGGLDPAIAPDGTVAYMDVSSPDGETDLWLRNPDGSQPRLLLPASPGFLALFSPRFSPDGRTVLISAAPDPSASATLAYADGFPQDFYAVPVAGGAPRRLTAVGGDRPSAAWSGDGHTILFNDISGLFLMNADGSGVTRLGDGYQHAQIAWLEH
jgi:Tol biopolymer transport system component